MATRYGVWCKVTDSKNVARQSWLKDAGIITLYATEKAAAEQAKHLQTTMNRSAFHTSQKFEYEAREIPEDYK